MRAKSTNRLSARVWHFGLGGVLLTAGGLIDQRVAAAPTGYGNPNNVIATPLPAAPVETQWQQDQPNEMNVFEPAEQPAGNTLPEMFRYGPLWLRPHADYIFMYGTGFQNTPGNQQETILQELSPGILMDLGPHWALDYTPTFQFYSSDKFRDTMNQAVTLTGNVLYEAWTFGLAHNSQWVSMPTAGTGAQTDQTIHNTTLSASRALNSKVSLDLDLNQTITLVSGFEDSYDWSTLDWINYQFLPRLDAGIGVGGGYVLGETDGSANPVAAQPGAVNNLDQYYEQVQGRVNWRATQKISFQLNAGLEDREFSTAGAANSLEPVFGAAIQYQPFKATQISLSASRTVASSDYYLAAQETETTIVSVNLNQRLFRDFTVAVGAAYSMTDYSTPSGITSAALANRTDDQISLTARLSHPFFKRGTWSVFYQYADNSSSQAGYTFESNQSGFEISYSF